MPNIQHPACVPQHVEHVRAAPVVSRRNAHIARAAAPELDEIALLEKALGLAKQRAAKAKVRMPTAVNARAHTRVHLHTRTWDSPHHLLPGRTTTAADTTLHLAGNEGRCLPCCHAPTAMSTFPQEAAAAPPAVTASGNYTGPAFTIKTFNAISPVGLNRFPTGEKLGGRPIARWAPCALPMRPQQTVGVGGMRGMVQGLSRFEGGMNQALICDACVDIVCVCVCANAVSPVQATTW